MKICISAARCLTVPNTIYMLINFCGKKKLLNAFVLLLRNNNKILRHKNYSNNLLLFFL